MKVEGIENQGGVTTTLSVGGIIIIFMFRYEGRGYREPGWGDYNSYCGVIPTL